MNESSATDAVPSEGAGTHGHDLPLENRPGVPMEAAPQTEGDERGRAAPPQQPRADEHLHRAGIDEPTPVFGTAQPPRGLSGLIRRGAYRIPEHYARHWMLLLLADRVDVLEDRLGAGLGHGLERAGMHRVAEPARRNPLPLLAGAAAGLWIGRRIIS